MPVTGSAADERAIGVVSHLIFGHRQPVTVTLLYVVEVKQSMPLDAELPTEVARGVTALDEAEIVTQRHLAQRSDQVFTELLQARSAGAAIVDEATDRNADAIVMAAVNHHKLGRVSTGETVKYVLQNAPCEVIVVRVATDGLPSGASSWH